METKWYKYYLYGFLAILALPVISTPTLLQPTAWGKGLLLRIIVPLLLFLFIYDLSANKQSLKPIKKIGPILLIALLVLTILSTIFSLDPNYSFWDSPLRGGGSLNYSLYIVFSLLLFLVVKKEDWKKLFKFNILIGVLVSLITLLQYFGLFESVIKTYHGRPPGTMGGPIFLGLYMLFLFFISLSLALKEKKYFIPTVLFFYIIIVVSSRAAWLGLLVGLVYFILMHPGKEKLWKIVKITALALIILGFLGIYYLNTSPNLLHRVSGRLSYKLATDDPRFSAWTVSKEALFDYPVFGYGPENFSIAFDRYYDPSLPFINKDWGGWYDKAHNFIFELTITYGIPFFLVYLALIIYIFIKGNHLIRSTLFAYITANFFSFDVVSTYILFFFLIAYVLSYESD